MGLAWGSLTYEQGCPAVEPFLAASWFPTPLSLSLAERQGCELTPEAPGGRSGGGPAGPGLLGDVEAGWVLGRGFILLVNGCSQIPPATGHSTPCGGSPKGPHIRA